MEKGRKRNYFFLFVIIFLASLLRFGYLDRVPSAISGDELTYILEAKSISVSGKDLSGTWNPLSVFFFKYPPGVMQAELPYILNIPVVGLSKLSLFSARFTNALLSIFTVIGLYLLAVTLFNEEVAVIVGLIAAINPWGIFIGRTAYEVVPAVCFIIWAMYMSVVRKGNLLLWSIPVYMLAFYSYIGTKVIILPIVIIVGIYVIKVFPGRQTVKRVGLLILSIFLLSGFYLYELSFLQTQTRMSQIIRPDDPIISQTVNSLRSVSMPNIFMYIFINKYVVLLNIVVIKLFNSLSFDNLFLHGDIFYSLYNHGLFYVVDIVFCIIGLLEMYAKKRRVVLLFLAILFVGTIPHLIYGIDTANFTPHIALIVPFIILFIGYGIYICVFKLFPKYKIVLSILVIVCYSLFLGRFAQLYLFQYPLTGQFDFPIRVLTKYLEFQKSDRQVLVYIARHEELFKRYLFYSNGINSRTIFTIRKIYDANIIPYKNVIFMGCDERFTIPENTTVVYDSQCNKPLLPDPFVKITRLNDGGDSFKIYNDMVCVNYQLKPYASNITLGELAIESLNEKTFCETYIAK